MKKMLVSSILGLASLCMWAAPSQAWTFGLIPWHCWPCGGCAGRCCSSICIRPYNAFSPVASGSMCFDGCAPFCNACPRGYPGMNQGGYPGMCPGGACPGGYDQGVLNYQGIPECGAESAAPVQAPGAMAMPYGGPVPPAYSYGYAPTYAPYVTPAAAAQYNWAPGYGR